MPSTKKTLPNDRKRVTASARARVSVKKAKKGSLQLDGSYLEKATSKRTVSTSSSVEPVTDTSTPSQNDAIMTMLNEIKESNTALAKRMDKVERIANRDATPLNPRSHAANFPSHSSQMGSPQLNNNMDPVTQIRDPLNLLYPRQDQGQLFSRCPYSLLNKNSLVRPSSLHVYCSGSRILWRGV